ncbi:spermatogenesis-associated protein 20 isoform X1 [Bradysia coprophila]|uniref:spermatogenesis-associated protein 20 isoform X1 n=2 Tax=Bradysia coprophila TaxID=38358 RepID=UPI00187DC084|nr:spermatogenesis-associated protein 20 isoform X1 [Bradysia coprophila]
MIKGACKLISVLFKRRSNIQQQVRTANFPKYSTNQKDFLRSRLAINETARNMASSSSHTNRLALEKSPYLLQHAHNPVDWYPWSEEAFQRARDENKMIFLSVGYSTCHWCHVMEKESFENEETAKIMNEHFINVKVDREERPDIDKIYMSFLLMIKGSGGWPMSVWLTPDLAPITAGTYFPQTDRWGMPGFRTVLMKIHNQWKENKNTLGTTGKNVIEAMQKSVSENEGGSDIISVEAKFNQAVNIYKRNIDDDWGGFGSAPKFPEVSKLNLIFHAHVQQPTTKVLPLVLHTLKKIGEGGIHDHVFGGFARYSVDRKWHVPHFEKMLYDQGQLLMAYVNALKMTKDERYLDVADNLFNYICKDLRHPSGGFFSGEDADSYPNEGDDEKIEGAFYAWDWTEISDLFEENSSEFSIKNPFDVYSYFYGIKEEGNVEPASDPHGHLLAKNILMVRTTHEATSTMFGISVDEIKKNLRKGNELLRSVREKRPRPQLDTKVLTAWNGLMLSGLAKLACVKDAPNRSEYLKISKQLVEFLKKYNFDEKSKTLFRSCYGEGTDSEVASFPTQPISGFLNDYAFLIKGLLDYYLASMDSSVLLWAKELQATQDKLFWDTNNHGYFYSKADSADVIVRLKDDHDGAEPCGNSVAASNLLLLHEYFDDESYKATAQKLFHFFNKTSPFGYALPEMMSALLLYDSGLTSITVVGPDTAETKKMLDVARDFYIPGLVLIHSVPGSDQPMTKQSASQYQMVDDRATAYLCHDGTCEPPITLAEKLNESLAKKYLFK